MMKQTTSTYSTGHMYNNINTCKMNEMQQHYFSGAYSEMFLLCLHCWTNLSETQWPGNDHICNILGSTVVEVAAWLLQ